MQRIPSFIAGTLFGGALVFVLLPRMDRPAVQAAPLPRDLAYAEACVLPPAPVVIALPVEAVPVVLPATEPVEAPSPPRPALDEELSQPLPQVPSLPLPGPLTVPVAGIRVGQLADTFTDSRSGGRLHDAIDIMAPAGTPVLAVDDGRVVKLFSSVAGGLTLYQFDPDSRYVYYYAHLLGYAPDIAEGRLLRRGERIGYVGTSGNASPLAPHLHFAVSVLGPERQWWKGRAINPYPLFVDTQ